MSGAAIITIVVVLVVLAVGAALAIRRAAGTRTANAQYDKRRRRVDGLGIRPLSSEKRALYGAQWVAAQEAFITSPAQSAQAAAALVTAVAAERGYEVADTGQLLDDLSVYHGNQLDGYRSALATTGGVGETATEGLRQAMLDYRAMFCALAEIGDSDEMAAMTAAATTTGAGGARAQAADATSETG